MCALLACTVANARLQPEQNQYLDELTELVNDSIRISSHELPMNLPVVDSIAMCQQVDTITKPHLLRIKTNAIGWALLNGNLAVEYTFNDHWAIGLAVYYGALNYFTSTVKFRTHAFMPELRYYSELNEGLFVGLHAGVAYWNFALGASTRFQDHRGKSPAYGGGITIGYIKPLDKAHRWNMEFALGAGLYHLRYDKFYNVRNGAKFDQKHKTDIYVDNVAVTFSYTFDLSKKHHAQQD